MNNAWVRVRKLKRSHLLKNPCRTQDPIKVMINYRRCYYFIISSHVNSGLVSVKNPAC